ncbi:MAG: response regulator [Chitinophagaceae bacterium]
MIPVLNVNKIPHIVLAVDDADESILFINALANLHTPYFFTVVKNGEKLLHVLDQKDFKPDFIFMDLQIPRGSGEAWLKIFKTRKSLDTVPVILYSMSGNPEDKDYCYNVRANEYFLKVLSFLL